VIAERFMRPGERADIGDEVVRLIDANDLEIQARAPLASINYIKEGMSLDVKTDVGERVKATLRTIVPIGDARSRLLDLRLDFTGINWRVGQPVRVALPMAVAKQVLTVPRDALVLRRDGSSIFKINRDDIAEKVSVEIGIAAGEYVEVRGDIKDGDRVVIRGGERLRPGQKVQILSESKPS
jgi:RND family efflux transporter MFP subunit